MPRGFEDYLVRSGLLRPQITPSGALARMAAQVAPHDPAAAALAIQQAAPQQVSRAAALAQVAATMAAQRQAIAQPPHQFIQPGDITRADPAAQRFNEAPIGPPTYYPAIPTTYPNAAEMPLSDSAESLLRGAQMAQRQRELEQAQHDLAVQTQEVGNFPQVAPVYNTSYRPPDGRPPQPEEQSWLTGAITGLENIFNRGSDTAPQAPNVGNADAVPPVAKDVYEEIGKAEQAVTSTPPEMWDQVPSPIQSLIIRGLELADKPRQWNSGNIGNVFYTLATGSFNDLPTWLQAAMASSPMWAAQVKAIDHFINTHPEFRNQIIDAHNQGGGRGVWEHALISQTNDLPWYIGAPLRFAIDFTIDPLGLPSFLAGGAGAELRALSRGIHAGEVAGSANQARTLDVFGRILELPEAVQNAPVDAIAGTAKGLGKSAEAINRFLAGEDEGLWVFRRAKNIARERELLAEQAARAGRAVEKSGLGVTPEEVAPPPEAAPTPPEPPGSAAPEPDTRTGTGVDGDPTTYAYDEPIATPPPETQVAEVPTVRKTVSGRTRIDVGEKGRVRVLEDGDGAFHIQTKESGKWVLQQVEENVDTAERVAQDIYRERYPAPAPEPTAAAPTPPASTFQPPSSATLGYNTPEWKAALDEGRISELTPQWQGPRATDRLYTDLMTQGRSAEWDAFVESYSPYAERFKQRLANTHIDDATQWQATLNVMRAEHMVDDFMPVAAYTTGDIPEFSITAKRNLRNGAKQSYQKESDAWLIQRAIYTNDKGAVAELRKRWSGAPWADSVLTRIEGARSRFAEYKTRLASGADIPSPGPVAMPPPPAQTIPQPPVDAIPQAPPAPPPSRAAAGIAQEPFTPNAGAIDQRIREDIGDTAIPRAVDDTSLVGHAYNQGVITDEEYQVLTTPVVTKDGETTVGQIWAQANINHPNDIEAAEREMRELLLKSGEAPQEVSRLMKIAKGADRVWLRAGQQIRANIQYNIATGIRGPLSDQIGDFWQLMVAGSPESALRTMNPAQMIHWWKLTRGEKSLFGKGSVEDLFGYDTLRNVGKEPPIHQVARYTPRSDIGEGLPMTRLTKDRNRITQTFGGIVQNKWIHDLRQALDNNRRWTAYMVGFKKQLAESRTTFFQAVKEYAARNGLSEEQLIAQARSLGPEFSSADVRRVMQGGQDGELSRLWTNLLKNTEKSAKDFEDNLLFSYESRNVDDVLRHGLFFHYWQSRALMLHARATLSNWPLMTAYYRAWQGLEEEADKRGFPPTLKGYIKFMGSYGGMMGLISPLALLTPFTMFQELAIDHGEGKAWKEFAKGMVFLNPMVEAAAAALGYEWGGSTPNLLGIRAISRDVQAVVNFGRSHGVGLFGQGYAHNWEERTVSGILNKVADALGKDYKAPQSGAGDIVKMRAMVDEAMQAEYGPMTDWTPQQWEEHAQAYDALETGATNKWADPAFRDFANAGITGAVVRGILPGTTSSYGPLNAAREDASEGFDALRAGGQPTDAQQNAMLQTGIERSGSAEDMNLAALNAQYHDIPGSDWAEMWNSVAFGVIPSDKMMVFKDGSFFTAGQINQMTPDQRKQLADAWVADAGGTAYLEQVRQRRDEFKQANPEYAAFADYQSNARDYDEANGAGSFAKALAKANPNFRKAVEGKDDPAAFALSLDGYLAANGYRTDVYAEAPIATRDQSQIPYIPTAPAADTSSSSSTKGGSSGGVTVEGLSNDMTNFMEDQATYDAKAKAAGWENTSSDPYMAQAMENRFGAKPKPSARLRRYLEWRAAQPDGSDVSFAAYIAYREGFKPAA